ncbi:MAG: hypothetical protein JNK16_00310 [Phycisphaerales bacterium]|nr:hypothetical protein [Phycisphaerales bacterium]
MFIYFGEKTERFKVGRVATFCPICRDVAVHRLVSVRQQMHVQGIGIGRGKELHEETTCEVCGLLRGVESGGFVGFSKPRDRHSLEEVIAWSRPDLMELCAEWFEMEERLDRLEPAERAGLISEAFTSVNYMFQVKGSSILADVWFMALLTVFAVSGVCFAGLTGMMRPHPVWWWMALGLTGVSFLAMMWRGASARRRYARRVIAPMLARCLAPMNLSAGEVEMGMRQLDPKLQGALPRVGE